MKKTLLLILVSFISYLSSAQLISSDPAFPADTDELTIYFDATEGNGGLAGYTEDVYVHIGVLTDESGGTTDWKYVKTSWGENTPETKLTRISDDYYSITLSPSIRDYFGVPATEAITHIAMVFRAHDNSREGKDVGNQDIFLEIFETGLSVSILNPDKDKVLNPGTVVEFSAASSETTDMTLYLNDTEVKSVNGTTLTHTFTFNDPGDYWIRISATNGEETDKDSVFVHVLGDQVIESLPAGMIDGVNIISSSSVTLVLYAPGKDMVFVVGDFSNWVPNSESRMKKDGNRFWITLENLSSGVEYGYQYFIDGELYLADPYAEKVLDPYNDKWIDETTYPDLKAYPEGKTTGIVSVFKTDETPYQWVNNSFNPQAQESLVIYEMLLRDFLAAHDWTTLTDTLDYFSDLGVSALEIMPFNEFEGNESWGYNPSFYFAPDKYYGPAEDLQAFIDSCHGRGIAVIMDMVLNHSYGQSPLVQLYYDNSTSRVTSENPWYNVTSPNSTYSWGYDFDHESQATKDFVDRVNSYWLTKYKLDGFRFDFTKGFTNNSGDGWAYDGDRIAILKRMADEIWTVNPDAYIILEHFADNSEEKELSDYGMMIWGNMNYNYGEASMGFNDENKSDFSWVSYQNRGWNNANLVGYMESHDEERLMYRNLTYGNFAGTYLITNPLIALQRAEIAAVFFLPVPGPKMIWQFGELGYDYSIEYNGRVGNKPIVWEYFDDVNRGRLHDVYAALAHLKTTEDVFSTSDFAMDVSGAGKRIELNHADYDVRIIGNFDVRNLSVDPNFSSTGYWYDYFAGDSINVTDPNALINLKPGAYKLYTSKRLKKPMITDIEQHSSIKDDRFIIYPNPASDFTIIEADRTIERIHLYTLNGHLVKNLTFNNKRIELSLADLPNGIYICNIEFSDGDSFYNKLIKN